MSDFKARLAALQQVISDAAQAADRDPTSIRLIGASKAQPPDAVRALYDLGLREFGENYAQEMATKAEALSALTDLRWIYIGRLQSNKIGLIARTAAEVQSLASFNHARLLERHVTALGKAPFPVYILVNAGLEASKDGLSPAEVPAFADRIARELSGLDVQGIMAIPPPLRTDENAATPPPLYRELRALADRTGRGRLSLGMSSDLAEAIRAGTDCVRIGTALFGPRPPR